LGLQNFQPYDNKTRSKLDGFEEAAGLAASFRHLPIIDVEAGLHPQTIITFQCASMTANVSTPPRLSHQTQAPFKLRPHQGQNVLSWHLPQFSA